MPLPPTFAKTGFAATPATRDKIELFQVLGERGSGTNFVSKVLALNTSLSPSDLLGWKHGFPHMVGVPFNMGVICVVRRADDWARSLFETPWHSTPHLQALDFSAFLRAPWDTVVDKPKYFKGMMQPYMRMAALQHDRDPITGAMFENIFALRKAKLAGLFSMLGRDCPAIVLRMEEFQRDPEAGLDQICASFGVRRNAKFEPFLKRQGWRFRTAVENRPPLPDAWTPEDYAYLKAQVDPDQEAAMGYTYTDPPTIKKRHIRPEWSDVD